MFTDLSLQWVKMQSAAPLKNPWDENARAVPKTIKQYSNYNNKLSTTCS